MSQEDFVVDYEGSNILENTKILGSIESDKDIYLAGCIEGNVNCKGKVIINEGAVVDGDVNCNALFLNGNIVGNVSVNKKAILGASAKIQGGLTTSCLEITSGAEIVEGLRLKKKCIEIN